MELPFNVVVKNRVLGGGVLPYISQILYVPPRRAGYLGRVCLKTGVTGVHFAHFGLDSGMVFEGLTGVYEMNEKKEKLANSKWI